MKKLFAPTLGLLAVAGLFFSVTSSAALITDIDNPENVKTSTTWGGSARTAVRQVVNYFLYFLGLIATIMVIYGGFLYVTSGGEEKGAEKGKNILIYAAVGIIIILISFAVVNTVLKAGMNVEPLL